MRFQQTTCFYFWRNEIHSSYTAMIYFPSLEHRNLCQYKILYWYLWFDEKHYEIKARHWNCDFIQSGWSWSSDWPLTLSFLLQHIILHLFWNKLMFSFGKRWLKLCHFFKNKWINKWWADVVRWINLVSDYYLNTKISQSLFILNN